MLNLEQVAEICPMMMGVANVANHRSFSKQDSGKPIEQSLSIAFSASDSDVRRTGFKGVY